MFKSKTTSDGRFHQVAGSGFDTPSGHLPLTSGL